MKRIRIAGKVATKYDIAFELEFMNPRVSWTMIYDAYSYAELCKIYEEYLLKRIYNKI